MNGNKDSISFEKVRSRRKVEHAILFRVTKVFSSLPSLSILISTNLTRFVTFFEMLKIPPSLFPCIYYYPHLCHVPLWQFSEGCGPLPIIMLLNE